VVNRTIDPGIGGVKSNARLVIGRRIENYHYLFFSLAELSKKGRFFGMLLNFSIFGKEARHVTAASVAISVLGLGSTFLNYLPRAGSGNLHTSQLPRATAPALHAGTLPSSLFSSSHFNSRTRCLFYRVTYAATRGGRNCGGSVGKEALPANSGTNVTWPEPRLSQPKSTWIANGQRAKHIQ
jgi:hypothetical protein